MSTTMTAAVIFLALLVGLVKGGFIREPLVPIQGYDGSLVRTHRFGPNFGYSIVDHSSYTPLAPLPPHVINPGPLSHFPVAYSPFAYTPQHVVPSYFAPYPPVVGVPGVIYADGLQFGGNNFPVNTGINQEGNVQNTGSSTEENISTSTTSPPSTSKDDDDTVSVDAAV